MLLHQRQENHQDDVDDIATPPMIEDDAVEQQPPDEAAEKDAEEELSNLNHNDLRLAANARFAVNALDEALPLYSLAVEVVRHRIIAESSNNATNTAAAENNDDDSGSGGVDYRSELIIQLCNRSACLYKMEMYNAAKDDAAEAVALSGGKGNNPKALFRLARSQMALGEYEDAMVTLDRALQYCDEQLNKAHSGHDNDNHLEERERTALTAQKNEFQKLVNIAKRKKQQSTTKSSNNNNNNNNATDDDTIIQSIKLEPRTPSIREFIRPSKVSDDYHPLGEGNFSTVVICQHKTTLETFALKIIEKEQCTKLAKRQHPNVHNEVQMERRILTQHRILDHVNIVKAYHAMQDYNSLYFLMELHQAHGDLWSLIRYNPSNGGGMVGMHPSLIRIYMYELVSAVEHCHKHGIVHRDIKPENVLLSERNGHVVLIDFGTAKDLIQTDLNGPEFVGTPDFMSPEAVREFDKGGSGCDFTADLWALGVMVYQMYAGALPFEAASPYLTFLKIQRGVFGRSMGVWDEASSSTHTLAP